MAKRKTKIKRRRLIRVKKHGVIRKSCFKCKRPHTRNEDRHHGIGSYCKYHRKTPKGKKYCKQ